MYQHPYGRAVVGPGVRAAADDVDRLAAAWDATLTLKDHGLIEIAINRACGLPDNAPLAGQQDAIERCWPIGGSRRGMSVEAYEREQREMCAAFQTAYEQLVAEAPSAPPTVDPVDVWLHSARDAYQHGATEWTTVDRLIHDYRAHLRDGLPLDAPHGGDR